MIPKQPKAAAGEMIIISGKACAGKTTVGRALSYRLDVPFISMGEFSREHARSVHGVDIHTFQKLCLENPQLDLELDHAFCEQCRTVAADKGAIVDFRLGGYFFPNSHRVYLDISDEVAAAHGKERGDETLKSIRARNEAMCERLQRTYGYDFTDQRNYRHVIVVDEYSAHAVTNMIYSSLPMPWPVPNNSRHFMKRKPNDGIWGVDFGNGAGNPW